MKKDLSIKVIPTLDSNYGYKEKFENLPIYFGKIEGEKEKPFTPKCFAGAWYRKVVSNKDKWCGMEGIIELGEFHSDPKRYTKDTRMDLVRDLDNPSIYMGGFALSESDAGLGMNVSYPTGDTSYELDYSSPRYCFKPFWRYIYKTASDNNGNVDRHSINSWNITDPRLLQYYYFPGDVLRMAIYSPIPNYLQLKIEVIKPTTIEKYVNMRKSYNLVNDMPSNFYSPLFYSEGHGTGMDCEYKRVNSIDQYGNEGLIAIPTDANITSTWHECFLYRIIDGKLYKVPFIEDRQASMMCPNEKAVKVTKENLKAELGAEKIELFPSKCND